VNFSFKLWECASDAISYLQEQAQQSEFSVAGKSVLDLGCGHGLPGIVCLLSGASRVCFFVIVCK
jgi:predicted nicotinamide N-methyase